ncbi:hypothetical protein FRUB_05544 [Fimbriiglobus ruber]|uniref:Uncharacterized protein n=2 Tax=Fimbriiglobus ruber TaxID=1908690 RepID=A0A225DWE0_9BACT|nr:hypothetical protein FRUB_05544 [Fimbriiglobus ruber]
MAVMMASFVVSLFAGGNVKIFRGITWSWSVGSGCPKVMRVTSTVDSMRGYDWCKKGRV